MALLEVQDLKVHIFTKRGIVKAVDGVTYSVAAGETLGLIGESGCGKTTSCLSILKLLPDPGGRIVGGRIVFDGEDLVPKTERQMRDIRGRRISMILQDPMTSLNPAYTIGDQVSEAMSAHQRIGGRSLRDAALNALRLVKIPASESRLDDYPHQMSGGMRQRVAGAIAIIAQPNLLIADEATSSLDVTIQAQYLKLLKEVQAKTKVAMLFITHDFGIVAAMCDHVAVMYAGRIVEKADTRTLFNHARHPYTIALMNCLPKVDQWRELDSIPGQPPDLSHTGVGCSFAPRCARKTARCDQEFPAERMVGRGHTVSCWLVED